MASLGHMVLDSWVKKLDKAAGYKRLAKGKNGR